MLIVGAEIVTGFDKCINRLAANSASMMKINWAQRKWATGPHVLVVV
jgi:hypothetical protein